MKIGFVLDDTLDSTDGVQQYVLTLGAWLSAQGHEIHYLVGQTIRRDIPSIHSLSRNVAVRFNGNRMSMPLPASKRKIAMLLRAEKFDILHVQMPYSPWLAHRIILTAPQSTAVVGTFHIAPQSHLVHQANRMLGMWLKRSLRHFDDIVSVSSAAADFARQTYGIEPKILPNVVDVTNFANARSIERYTDKLTIVFLGRLVPRKGCQLLLEAAAQLRQDDQSLDFRVVVCGRGPLDTDLRTYVAAHDLRTTVEFTGFVSDGDKARFLKSADLAIFPSSGGESFGIVLLEAMAAGHPVVLAADNPGYATVMAPYPDTLFPVNNVVSLAHKIRFYLTNTAERQRALTWQAHYVPNYDVNVVGPKLINIFHLAIEKRAGRSTASMR
jgi:phosphatidylinositol alpha-mannosyltransferase